MRCLRCVCQMLSSMSRPLMHSRIWEALTCCSHLFPLHARSSPHNSSQQSPPDSKNGAGKCEGGEVAGQHIEVPRVQHWGS